MYKIYIIEYASYTMSFFENLEMVIYNSSIGNKPFIVRNIINGFMRVEFR